MNKSLCALALLSVFVLLPVSGHAAEPNRTDVPIGSSASSDRHGPDGDETDNPDSQDMDPLNGGLTHDEVPPPPPNANAPVYHDLSQGGPANNMAGAPTGAPPPGSQNQIPTTGAAQPGNWRSGPHPPALGPKTGGADQFEQR